MHQCSAFLGTEQSPPTPNLRPQRRISGCRHCICAEVGRQTYLTASYAKPGFLFAASPHGIHLCSLLPMPAAITIGSAARTARSSWKHLQNLDKLGKKARERSERRKEAKRGGTVPGEGYKSLKRDTVAITYVQGQLPMGRKGDSPSSHTDAPEMFLLDTDTSLREYKMPSCSSPQHF